MPEYQRYNLTLRVVDPSARDKFRALSRPESFYEIRPNRSPGQRGAYSVLMTQDEYEAALEDAQDPASNLIVIEPDVVSSLPSVPGAAEMQYMAAQDADSLGLTGAGVTIGLVDTGASSGVAAGFDIVAAKSFGNDTDPYNDTLGHGSDMIGIAVPPGASAAIAKAAPAPGQTEGGPSDGSAAAASYWLADEVGVDVILYEMQHEGGTVLSDAINNAASKNIIQVAPNGNGGLANLGGPGENLGVFPAGYSGALAISNYDLSTDAIAPSSNYGSHTWAAASGNTGGGGTSAASALATNMVARFMTGGRSPGNTVSYLASSARPTGASPLYEGNGVLQLSAAEQDLQQVSPPPTNLNGDPMAGEPVLDESGDPVLDENGEPTFAAAAPEGTGSPEPGACD